jgi:hypothetical protein
LFSFETRSTSLQYTSSLILLVSILWLQIETFCCCFVWKLLDWDVTSLCERRRWCEKAQSCWSGFSSSNHFIYSRNHTEKVNSFLFEKIKLRDHSFGWQFSQIEDIEQRFIFKRFAFIYDERKPYIQEIFCKFQKAVEDVRKSIKLKKVLAVHTLITHKHTNPQSQILNCLSLNSISVC